MHPRAAPSRGEHLEPGRTCSPGGTTSPCRPRERPRPRPPARCSRPRASRSTRPTPRCCCGRSRRLTWPSRRSASSGCPVERSWRLNERHYGALQGLDKKQTADQHGLDQVKLWRRSYDVPPPPVPLDSPEHPSNDPRYARLAPDVLPASECLADVVARVLAVLARPRSSPTSAPGCACSSSPTATACGRCSSTSRACPTRTSPR